MLYNAAFMAAAKPLYELGDLVAFYWESEDGLEFGVAYITGVEYKPPYTYVDNWWYAVRVLSPKENTDYDNMPEHEIIGRVIHGTQERFRAVRNEVGFVPFGAIHQSNGLGVG